MQKRRVKSHTENALVPIHNGLNRSFYTQFEIIDVQASTHIHTYIENQQRNE